MDETLNPSPLGTLEFYDDFYQTELENFSKYGDFGELWFGRLFSKRIIDWMVNNDSISKNANIIDIGCGDGMLLIELSKKGFTALHGIDYSKNAIDLAQSKSKKENCDIKFTVNNILQCSIPPIYEVALDKGTFDAISLDPVDSKSKREIYIRNVCSLLKDDGFLLITSCNWTEEELNNQFGSCFSYLETLPTPTFVFGGQRGKSVASIILKKI